MANQKLDLNNLKGEIESRKKNKNQESFGNSASVPKDAFLNGLLESLQTGRQNTAINHLKQVANKATDKKGGDKKLTISEQTENTSIPMNNQYNNYNRKPILINEDDSSREEEMFNKFQQNNKMTLAESIEAISGKQTNNQPRYNQSGGQAINEGLLVENVKNIVINYLAENLEMINEESTKNVILEMYAVERIKKVLQENKEIIKSIIYETLREIQDKNKAKIAKQQAH
jgi:hypothetical protein